MNTLTQNNQTFVIQKINDHFLRIDFDQLSLTESKVLAFLAKKSKQMIEQEDITPSQNEDFSTAIVANYYWQYFEPLVEVTKEPHHIIALDGHCGSGKSTFGQLLSEFYDCPLIHMDDFYLPISMRTKERLSEPGGNVYYERFLAEVGKPMQQHQPLHYGIFDCAIMDISHYQDIHPANTYVIEGSYAFHPTLIDLYDYKIFLTISKQAQQQRILERNGQEGLKSFNERWIPLEEHYFKQRKTEKYADFILDTTNFNA